MNNRLLTGAAVLALLLALAASAALAQDAPYAPAQPAVYAVLLDASKSVGPQFSSVKEAGRTLITSNREGDRAMLVRFVTSDEIKVLQDFTGDRDALLSALDKLYTDKGQSAVIDAIYVTAQAVAEQAKRSGTRGHMVVVTDGDDRNSYYNRKQLVAELRRSSVRVFTVGLVNGLPKGARSRAEKLLDQLAAETGGRSFFLESPAELPGIIAAIREEMAKP